MSGIRIMTSTILALAIVAINSAPVVAAETDASLRADLEHIAQLRIFFGHQSVGENVLDGIRHLSTTAGVPIHIVETPMASGVPPATLGNTFIARNGEPLLKLQSFEHAMGNRPSGVNIALMKFCFVDINADTDAKALFARYRETIEDLQKKNPDTTFVHVTLPLTSAQSGPKEFLKRLLGRGSSARNVRREEYNSLLRKTYQGREPIFDLARVESTAPDGTAITTEWNGIVVPALDPAYTDDGGHLNAVGKIRAAREFISVLAAIPERAASGTSTH
jgi:hypothetical protein